MTSDRYDPEPTAWVAWDVVGTKDDTTIEALRADGTTYDGQVILRIIVSGNRGTWGEGAATRCYLYHFQRGILKNAKAAQIAHCPSGLALRLPTPPRPPDLSEAMDRRLGAALTALSATQRLDPTTVQRTATALFSRPSRPRVNLAAALANDGSVVLDVLAGRNCRVATVPSSGPVTIEGHNGVRCQS